MKKLICTKGGTETHLKYLHQHWEACSLLLTKEKLK